MDKIQQLTIINHGDYLRQVSQNVDILDDKELKQNIEKLDIFCKENEVMAMAAIQLGISKRIVYLKNTNLEILNKNDDALTEEEKSYNESRILINPVVLDREGLTSYWEACASCLDYMGLVYRPYKILVEYYDMYGKIHEETFEGFEATVLSHELDHLDGILHIDIAEEVLNMPVEERKKWRETHGYEVLSKDGNYKYLKNEHRLKRVFK